MAKTWKPSRRVQSEPTNERWRLFMAGDLTIHDMDDEELARGQFRAGDGTFRGRPPKTIPRDFAQQLSRELLRRADSEFRKMLIEAVRTHGTVMRVGEKDADRLRAANLVVERTMGKVPDKVIVSEGRPEWESAVDEFLAGVENGQIERAREVLGRGGSQ